ncbi:MAG: hypothetical protein ABIP48_03110 [Planctomycetota bacterium]
MSLTRCFAVILLILWPSTSPADGPVTLPNTKPLTWEGDLSERMMDGGHTIHGQGTFEFLEEHLNWPAK